MNAVFPHTELLWDATLTAAVFVAILGCIASRTHFLADFTGWLRKCPVVRGLLVALLLAIGPVTTRSKNGQLSLPRPPLALTGQSTTMTPPFVCQGAGTNGVAMVAPTTNAVVSQSCLLHGANEQGEWIESDAPFFRWGTNDIRRLYASPGCLSFGTMRHPYLGDSLPNGTDAESLVVLRTPLGIVPEANWHLLEENGVVSRFWHDRLPGGGRVLTWENALLDRQTDRPVTIQAELRPDGDFVYRYDFSRATPTNICLIGAQRGAAAVEAFRVGPLPEGAVGGADWGCQTNGATIWRIDGNPNTNGVSIAGLFSTSPLVELRWKNTADLGDLALDPDGDGISSHDEILLHGTDPAFADTDADGIADNIELMAGADPLDADGDGDGIPDGLTPDAYDANPLWAESAEDANLAIVLQSAIPADGSATLVVGSLSLPLRNPASIPLSLPPGQFVPFRLVSRNAGPVALALAPGGPGNGGGGLRGAAPPVSGGPGTAIGLEDPNGVFGGAASSGSGRLAWATLSLNAPEGRCIHDNAGGLPFTVDLRPWPWASAAPFATLQGFELLPDNSLWLPGPESPFEVSWGSVSLTPPWLVFGSLSVGDSIHLCAGGGTYCLACGRVHDNDGSHSCSHADDCAAKGSFDADCDCPPLFVRVNSDDDDLDGVEDRLGPGLAPEEDDLLAYRAVGVGECCCALFDEAPVRITGASPGLRLWTVDGDRIASGGTVSDTLFLVEATAPSPGVGMGCVEYDILDEEGETVRSILRRFTMANVQIQPDWDANGVFDENDTYLRLQNRSGTPWLLARRPEPYRIRLKNECPSDAILSVQWSGATTNCPALMTDSNLAPQYLEPGQATTSAPFALPNLDGEFLIDASCPGAGATLLYSMDFGGVHPGISDSLSIRVVDMEMHDIAVTTNELSLVEYDFSQAGCPIEWTLHNLDTNCDVTNCVGSVFTPPDDLPVGTYTVLATFYGVCENGNSFAIRSAMLLVGSIVFEPQTVVLDPTGHHAVNPSCLAVGRPGWFLAEVSENFEALITWTADPAICVEFPDGTNGPTVSVEGRFFGDVDLRMDIAGFAGPAPQTTVRVMPPHSVPVNAWIVHDGSGTYPATPERIAECVEKANDIFYHTGLSFHLDSVSYTNNSDWKVIEQVGNHWPKMSDMCNITNGTGGIECYFVNEIASASGLNSSSGLAIATNASATVLAHEIGHACGLSDIYYSTSETPLHAMGVACQNWNQEDWGTTVSRGYYPEGTEQSLLIIRNVMHGVDDNFGMLELSRGDIYGLWYEWSWDTTSQEHVRTWNLSQAPVGLTTHAILPPQHQ